LRLLDGVRFRRDPILEANELKDRGQIARAKKLLESPLVKDVRCLDAHAHLGNMAFDKQFLRCLNGLGLCLWRLERFEEAEALFMRLLWMSPSDNLGIRFLLPPVQARKPWAADGS
jgi:hypothetical protein